MTCYHVRLFVDGCIPRGVAAHRETADGARRLAGRYRELARREGKRTALVDLSAPAAEPSLDHGFVARHGVLVEIAPGPPGCAGRGEPAARALG